MLLLIRAKNIACLDANDRDFYVKSACMSKFSTRKVTHQAIADSKNLFDTLTELHDENNCRLRQTVQKICESFDSGAVDSLK